MMKSIPPFLQKGQKVALVSPAGCISTACLKRGIRLMESWGLEYETGLHALKRYGTFAGTDEERAEDFQQALDAPEIKAIICTRGGYGSARIIDKLDFTRFRQAPKWITGFSDITVFHSHLQQNLHVASIHSSMPQTYPEAGSEEALAATGSLHAALFGEGLIHKFRSQFINRPGIATAPLIGGNLSILYSLRGTPTDIDPAGKILFLEDLDEYDYHIDRMLLNLARSGWFEKLAGLMVGTFTHIKKGANPYMRNVWEIISRYTEGKDYPVCYGFPAGHIPHNHALYMGIPACLEVSATNEPSQLSFLGVQRQARLTKTLNNGHENSPASPEQ